MTLNRFTRTWAWATVLGLLLVAGRPEPAATAPDKAIEDALFELQLIPVEGTPAPFALERLGDGKKVTLEEHRGRPVMLYFWATW
jgi:hypothetical protein